VIDQSTRTLAAGDLRVVFLPGLGMLGASLRHRGEELLGRVDEIEAFALESLIAPVAPNTGITLRLIKRHS